MNDDTLTLTTAAPAETEALGNALMAFLPDSGVVALYGDLGAGKTCLVRGMVSAVADPQVVSSPTFVIVNEYQGSRTVRHLDLYRLSTPSEIMDLGYEDLFDSPDGLCVVEWAERAADLLPGERLDIHLSHGGEDKREIVIKNLGLLKNGWQESIGRDR